MKAMILAAGRGERLRPLTDRLPKTLVEVAGKPLVAWHLRALAEAGFDGVVINLAYRGAQIRDYVGDGSAFGIPVTYSEEGEPALDTGGGIFNALPLLGNNPFVVINGDVLTDFPLYSLRQRQPEAAHLVLVDNPPHNPDGDFALEQDQVREQGNPMRTFAGIGVYHPALFRDCRPGAFPLGPLLKEAIRADRVSGERYAGMWLDVGTPKRLEEANRRMAG